MHKLGESVGAGYSQANTSPSDRREWLGDIFSAITYAAVIASVCAVLAVLFGALVQLNRAFEIVSFMFFGIAVVTIISLFIVLFHLVEEHGLVLARLRPSEPPKQDAVIQPAGVQFPPPPFVCKVFDTADKATLEVQAVRKFLEPAATVQDWLEQMAKVGCIAGRTQRGSGGTLAWTRNRALDFSHGANPFYKIQDGEYDE